VVKLAKLMDAVLIGPGLGTGEAEKKLTNDLLKKYPEKKFVLDADALTVLNPRLLNNNRIVTPHKQEFKGLFGVGATHAVVQRMAKKFKTTIVLKGKRDYIAGPDEFKINKTGNAGMTKGGTGDVLAGLITALAAKNDPFLAASSGVFINGLAGDRLAKQVANYYSASDLVKEIPKTIKWCLNY
jgi:NAD(P)H-hydrate epimerase